MQEPIGSDKDKKMENMQLEELQQLFNYYRQKYQEVEVSLLRLQMQHGNITKENSLLKTELANLQRQRQEEYVVQTEASKTTKSKAKKA